MQVRNKHVLLCNCDDGMPIEGETLRRACQGISQGVSQGASSGATLTLSEQTPFINSMLCRGQMENFTAALENTTDTDGVLVCCTQEAPLFLETAHKYGKDELPLSFVNIRERAGWATQAHTRADVFHAKIAALLAEAEQVVAPAHTVTLSSGGHVLIMGSAEQAMEAAEKLNAVMNVTVLISADATGGDTGDNAVEAMPPALTTFPLFYGTVRRASGHLGAFCVHADNVCTASPSARAVIRFDGAGVSKTFESDLILDLRGANALFNAPEKRDGYFHPDPTHAVAVMEALLTLSHMVGDFEKARYVEYDADTCTHARNGTIGCTRCVDLCPAGAITSVPEQDRVQIDPFICGGCGSCAGGCPTGAMRYTQPDGNSLMRRVRVAVDAFCAAMNTLNTKHGQAQDASAIAPIILCHDPLRGQDMVHALARCGDGLPAAVIPLVVNEVPQVGLEIMLASLAWGAAGMVLLVDGQREHEASGLHQEAMIANAIMTELGYGGAQAADFVQIISESDPLAMGAKLHGLTVPSPAPAAGFDPVGAKRSVLNLALAHLHKHAPVPADRISLPDGAPFGAVLVDTAGCTLCLACAGTCPTGALKDNPHSPQLSFCEEACVQCGLCRTTCPENVITLEPRLSFLDEARRYLVVKEEDPFECVRCGKAFGVRSSIERMIEKLKTHSMFKDADRITMLRMCDDCRVAFQFEDKDTPMQGNARPVPRTTDDYLRARKATKETADKGTAKNKKMPLKNGDNT